MDGIQLQKGQQETVGPFGSDQEGIVISKFTLYSRCLRK